MSRRSAHSVEKTGRRSVLHVALLTGGFGGEIAAVVAREAFYWLDALVARLGALDTPVPFAKALEALHSPKGARRRHCNLLADRIRAPAFFDPLHQVLEALALLVGPRGRRGPAAPGRPRHARAGEEHGAGKYDRALPTSTSPTMRRPGRWRRGAGRAPRRDDQAPAPPPANTHASPSTAWSSR